MKLPGLPAHKWQGWGLKLIAAPCPFPTVFFHSLIWSVQPPLSEAGPLESLVSHPQVAPGCCKDEQSGYEEELSTKYRVACSLGSYWPP